MKLSRIQCCFFVISCIFIINYSKAGAGQNNLIHYRTYHYPKANMTIKFPDDWHEIKPLLDPTDLFEFHSTNYAIWISANQTYSFYNAKEDLEDTISVFSNFRKNDKNVKYLHMTLITKKVQHIKLNGKMFYYIVTKYQQKNKPPHYIIHFKINNNHKLIEILVMYPIIELTAPGKINDILSTISLKNS